MSGNLVGKCGINSLNEWICSSHSCNLREINISKNNLSDRYLTSMINSLNQNKKLLLRTLDISQNAISKNTLEALAEYLPQSQLISLGLSYGMMEPHSLESILNGLQTNSILRYLDISYNNLGLQKSLLTKKMQNNPQILFSKCLVKLFENNTTLLHLDISYTNMSLEECKEIRKALFCNESIQGFHFDGNLKSFDA